MTAGLERVRAGPLRFAFHRIGSGPPLLLLHGAEGDHRIYDRLQEALGDRVDSISFDQRDCGWTEWDDPAPYDLKDLAEDAVRFMDALGLRTVHVLGNSIGGVLAQLLAVNWPDRVDRLVLGFTWSADERLQDLNPQAIARRAEYGAMGAAGEERMVELMAGPGYLEAHPEVLDELRSLRSEAPAEARARRQAAFSAPHAADPSRIRQPTLVVAGGADQMVPAALVERLAGRIPNARFALLPKAGHLAARQFPGELADVIASFLLV